MWPSLYHFVFQDQQSGAGPKKEELMLIWYVLSLFLTFKTWSDINFNDMNKKYIITNKCLMICFCSHPAAIDLADRCTSASFYPGSPEWGRKKGCPIENQYQHQETFNPINTKKHSETWPVALRSSRPGVRSTQDQHRQWPNFEK